ncbi:MAG: hypothetical protein M1840_002301 [Geoglossum simile]|nr:MAG: hypothetical protein M1840_002301 [Geoglossum simile]
MALPRSPHLHLTPPQERSREYTSTVTAASVLPPQPLEITLADMTDPPPASTLPDPSEQLILDRLLSIRDELCLLKQDKSTYVKSHDVISLHGQVLDQVHRLNQIQADKRREQNRAKE